eukprot:5565841-Prymnesium_polylepis.1
MRFRSRSARRSCPPRARSSSRQHQHAGARFGSRRCRDPKHLVLRRHARLHLECVGRGASE